MKRFAIVVLAMLLASPAMAKWRQMERVDPVDDGVTKMAAVESKTSALLVMCLPMDDGPLGSIAFALDRPRISSKDLVRGIIRIDRQEPVDLTMILDDDYKVVRWYGMESTGGMALFDKLSAAIANAQERVVLRATVENSGTVTQVFDVDGSAAAIAPVRSACGLN